MGPVMVVWEVRSWRQVVVGGGGGSVAEIIESYNGWQISECDFVPLRSFIPSRSEYRQLKTTAIIC